MMILMMIKMQPGNTAVFKYDQDGNANPYDPNPNDRDDYVKMDG